MCCAPSVCNGGAQRRSVDGGWVVGRVTGRGRRQRRRQPSLESRPRRWDVCVSAPSFSWDSIVDGIPLLPPLEPTPGTGTVHHARTGVGRAPGSAACHAGLVGNVVVVVVARCSAWGRGARRRKPADRLDRVGSGRAVGGWRLAVRCCLFFPSLFLSGSSREGGEASCKAPARVGCGLAGCGGRREWRW